MRSHLVIVPTPSLAFSDRVVEATEQVSVQALRSELVVQGVDERIFRRLAWSAEVQHDTADISSQVQVAGDGYTALVSAERHRIAHLRRKLVQALPRLLPLGS